MINNNIDACRVAFIAGSKGKSMPKAVRRYMANYTLWPNSNRRPPLGAILTGNHAKPESELADKEDIKNAFFAGRRQYLTGVEYLTSVKHILDHSLTSSAEAA